MKAKRILSALERIGWRVKRTKGSHRILEREGWSPYTFSFHDSQEVGAKAVARIARETGLRPEDL